MIRARALALSVGLLIGCASLNSYSKVESAEVMARPAGARAEVKHILLGYSWLASKYRQMGLTLDARAENRNESATEQLALELLKKLQAGEPIEPLMAQYSEDEGSARTGISYQVTPDARLVDPFKQLSLRLNPGESGIVRSEFGYHVVKRVK